MKRYNNYHKHDHVSSILTPDSCVKAEDYIKRAVELGHNTYFTTNHGTGGDIFEARMLCDKYGLRCLFGIEGYIVPNPLEKDKRNYHIIIIPKTDEARKKVNYVNSMAHIKGFYYKPRIFIDNLLALDKDDVFITTACVAGIIHDRDAIEQIFEPLVKHFGKNVYLEVQPHNCDVQRSYNELCVTLARRYDLELIAANDSHYIYPEQAIERKQFLEGKGISYKDEGEDNAFILDYPDRDTMVARFKEQGVLTDEQIERAIDNTLIFDSCDEIKLDKEIKMPSIYPNLTPQERVDELKKHVNRRFKQIIKDENLSPDEVKRYIKGIREEMQVIQDTMEINTADYFLFNEQNVDLAVNKYGGILTRTGRGSCGAYYINKILGITQIDRFASPIPLYPERFISSARLLENRTIPDIDYNVVAQEPFEQASKELLGEHGCYPMIAYGTMQEGEAFRNVCRSHGLTFTDYNDVAKDIEAYRNDEKWKSLIEEAQKYVGVIVSGSVHPCAFCLYNGDLRYELGVIRQGEAICVMMTSLEADDYKFLKNDYLIVSVWKIISETFEMLGKPIMPVSELLQAIENDDEVWDLYAKGMTVALNQCDSEWATKLVSQYKPRNLGELAKFISCLRPFFNSSRDTFINRLPYSTGSKYLDEVLKSSDGFILFQESLMQYFEWLSIKPAESIGLIKKISKKKIKPEDFANLKERLRKQWVINTGSEEMFETTFQTIHDCMSYGFAAPHSLSVSIDSLYGAYLKAHFPLEYYAVCLNNYVGDEERTNRLTEELTHFGIQLKGISFRYSGADYTIDRENKAIYKGITSLSYFGMAVAQKLFALREQKLNNFVEFLELNPCDTRQTIALIQLGYFSEFGKSQYLLDVYEVFNKYSSRKQLPIADLPMPLETALQYGAATEKTFKFADNKGFIAELCKTFEQKNVPIIDRIKAEDKFLGHIDYINPKAAGYGFITHIDTTYSPKITLYMLDTGKSRAVKMVKKDFAQSGLTEGMIIKFNVRKKNRRFKKNDKWYESPDEFEDWISSFVIKEL